MEWANHRQIFWFEDEVFFFELLDVNGMNELDSAANEGAGRLEHRVEIPERHALAAIHHQLGLESLPYSTGLL